MSIRTQLAYLAAILTLGLGIASLVIPLNMVLLVGFDIIQPRALSEMRSTYGAMFAVMGAIMLYAIPTRPRTALYLRFAGFLWLGAAAGRLLSMIIDGVLTPVNVAGLALELLVGVGALLGSLENPKKKLPEA
jgi:Domain of unknown function (DUF4345)